MVNNQHNTGYKELFSYPEFVQQFMEGFAPPEIAQPINFSTLKNHSGNYITPCSRRNSKTWCDRWRSPGKASHKRFIFTFC